MKHFVSSIIFLFCIQIVNAQQASTQRQININIIKNDSVSLAFNENFELIEDSCSQIIRYTRVGMQESKFVGKITDVSKTNPALIITEGYYNADGLKDGKFTAHFLNGKLQARGNFKNNLFDGKWEVFYDDDKPKMTFTAKKNNIKVIDAWNDKGDKIVENGKGTYRVEMDGMYWKGKLLDGKPDGTWKAIRTNDESETGLMTESFKNGSFQKGDGVTGAYSDSSRLQLFTADMLPFTHAELFLISATSCNSVKSKRIVGAHYYDGLSSLTGKIQDQTNEALQFYNLDRFQYGEVTITGEISTIGTFTQLSAGPFSNQPVVMSLMRYLQRVPAMHPATIDDVPVVQKFAITYSFNSGICRFTYRILPVEVK